MKVPRLQVCLGLDAIGGAGYELQVIWDDWGRQMPAPDLGDFVAWVLPKNPSISARWSHWRWVRDNAPQGVAQLQMVIRLWPSRLSRSSHDVIQMVIRFSPLSGRLLSTRTWNFFNYASTLSGVRVRYSQPDGNPQAQIGLVRPTCSMSQKWIGNHELMRVKQLDWLPIRDTSLKGKRKSFNAKNERAYPRRRSLSLMDQRLHLREQAIKPPN